MPIGKLSGMKSIKGEGVQFIVQSIHPSDNFVIKPLKVQQHLKGIH